MRYLPLSEHEQNTYNTIVLVRNNAFTTALIDKHIRPYIDDKEDTLVFTLKESNSKKVPIKLLREQIDELIRISKSLKCKYILACDGAYFKELTGVAKMSDYYGSILPCSKEGYEYLQIVLGTSPANFYVDPRAKGRLMRAFESLSKHIKGTYKVIGSDVVKSSVYPCTEEDIKAFLNQLHNYTTLTCDIEALSLKFNEAGISTIAFAWDEHNGGAFLVDRNSSKNIRSLLKEFFCTYQGKLIYHNAGFDIKCLIYSLWMDTLLDKVGLLEGLFVMTKNISCTQIETYLCTNTCTGNELGLKPNTQEYLGKYAEDCTDTSIIPNKDLLEYNLKDCLGTFWLHKKMYPKLIEDGQYKMYSEIMIPSVKLLAHVELTGMCLDMDKVLEAEDTLSNIRNTALATISNSKYMEATSDHLRKLAWEKDFTSRKNKAKNPDKIKPKNLEDIIIKFNPNSGKQVAILLHDIIGLEILSTTATGQPSTGGDELAELLANTSENDVQELLRALIDLAKVSKILTSFIPDFKAAVKKEDGSYYLHGSYKITGTISGRLSCTDPPMQTIPSGSKYAKLIKTCFVAPTDTIFCFSDYNSLESVVSAKITQDPNKLKVFNDGYDSHSYNAFYYWKDKMPDIINTVDSINSIKLKYKGIRQDSKPVTFAAQYFGTYRTFMKRCGMTFDDAKAVELNYHTLYKASDEWTNSNLALASKIGYVVGAYGLRVRTPILKKSLMNSKATTQQAAAESRSAGNALTQSYCILNSRSALEFMERVYSSKHKYDIRPCALIHDALYLYVSNDIDVLLWVNKNLSECMAWHDLPELSQDNIPLGGELDVCIGNWANTTTLPTNSTREIVFNLIDNYGIK